MNRYFHRIDGISDPFINLVCRGSSRSIVRGGLFLPPAPLSPPAEPSITAVNTSWSEGLAADLPALAFLVRFVGEVGLSSVISTGTSGPPVFLEPPRDRDLLRSTCAPTQRGVKMHDAYEMGVCIHIDN